MTGNIWLQRLSIRREPEQQNYLKNTFGIVKYKPYISRTFTFEENINKKLKHHLEYDTKKGYTKDMNKQKQNINKKLTSHLEYDTKKWCNKTAADIQTRFVKQKGGGYMHLQA